MLDARIAVYLALDALCAILAAVVAVFFLRSHRAAPEAGFDVPALAFGLYALSSLTVGVSAFRLAPTLDVVDALRTATGFAATLILFLHYAFRRARVPLRRLYLIVMTVVGALVVYVLAYAAPWPLPTPLTYLGYVRLVGAFLLMGAALLVVLEVRGREVLDLQVPFAYLLLALAGYTIGLANIYALGTEIGLAYAWRIAGLLLLLRVVWPSRGWAPAPP